jgi:hypothetical protein
MFFFQSLFLLFANELVRICISRKTFLRLNYVTHFLRPNSENSQVWMRIFYGWIWTPELTSKIVFKEDQQVVLKIQIIMVRTPIIQKSIIFWINTLLLLSFGNDVALCNFTGKLTKVNFIKTPFRSILKHNALKLFKMIVSKKLKNFPIYNSLFMNNPSTNTSFQLICLYREFLKNSQIIDSSIFHLTD